MSNVSEKISKRYARALFELCELTELDKIKDQLFSLARLWVENTELQRVATNPAYPLRERTAALQAVAERSGVSDGKVKNLLSLLAENNRLRSLQSIASMFSSMVDALRKALSLTVSSAFPISEDEKRKLADRLKHEFSGMASIDWQIEPALIGGLTIKAGDKLLDNSLRSSLDKVRAALIA